MIGKQLVKESPALFAAILPILSLLLCPTTARGQDMPLSHPYIPRPYGVVGFGILGSGYQSLSLVTGGGIRMDSPHILSNVEVAYGNARKVNDGTVNNHSGHERYAQARTFYRMSNRLYFGGGVQWSQTSTTNYSKQSWRPTLGVGKDFLRNTYSFRLQAMYILPGSDKSNGTKGTELSLTYPSPSSNHHFYLRGIICVYRFHMTDTFSDPVTSARQQGSRYISGDLVYNFIYRF